jgi:23S rRNA (cytosine1962-C5)-methyltransferase
VTLKSIKIKRNKEKRFLSGHPWVFSNEIESNLKNYEPGQVLDLADSSGRFLARGYINPKSLISFRLLSWVEGEEIDYEFFLNKITAAKHYRDQFLPKSSSMRIVYSESDYLPGLIIDKYEDVIVAQILTFGMEMQKENIVKALSEIFHPKAIVLRNDSKYRELEGLKCYKEVVGGELTGNVAIEEAGIKYEIDVMEGQKTGFFFDQRDNRMFLRSLSKGARVLDCYSYVGGFALNAAFAEAKEVTGIDSSELAVKSAKRNCEINGLTHARFEKGDVEKRLDQFVANEEKFDIVILDPPSLVKNRQNLVPALKLYRDINAKGMKLLNEGGILVSASCSQHVSNTDFDDVIARAAQKSGKNARIFKRGHQAVDHPVLPGMPETEYLKCLFVEID